jgi:hypothetical protein
MDQTSSLKNPGDETGKVKHVPFLARVAGVSDELTYNTNEVRKNGKFKYYLVGLARLILPAGLAVGVGWVGQQVMGYGAIVFACVFFLTNMLLQSLINPWISERRATGKTLMLPILVSLLLFTINGGYAATLAAWFLFKPEVDQRHMANVVVVMASSQEKRDLDIAESALERERASLVSKDKVNTSAVDLASQAYKAAQEATSEANKALTKEISVGNAGRVAGYGTNAKKLEEALEKAKAAEASALKVLEDARKTQAGHVSSSASLESAYGDAKTRYQAREKSLIEAGPGMVQTFKWLLGMLHNEPLLFLFAAMWTFMEAFSILIHAAYGLSFYDRVRLTKAKDDLDVLREARQIVLARRQADREHKEALKKSQRRDPVSEDQQDTGLLH